VTLGVDNYRDVLVEERYKRSDLSLSQSELARRNAKNFVPISALKSGTRVMVDINTIADKDPIWAPGTVRKAAYLQLSTMTEFKEVPYNIPDDDIGASISVHFDTGDWAHVMSLAKIKLVNAKPKRKRWANSRKKSRGSNGRSSPRPPAPRAAFW